jgi:transposase
MSRAKRLTAKEQGKIEALKKEGYSNRSIAKKIKRSPTVVDNYSRLKDNYGLKKKTGRKNTISQVVKKRIIHLASTKLMSSNQIKSELQLPQSARTIRRTLMNTPSLVYKKFKSKPPLTELNKKARLNFAQESVKARQDWSKIIWSDEKKFNLDGPDGLRYYWHDLRGEPTYLSKRAFGGGNIMVWGAFVGNKLLDLVVCEHTMDSHKYIELLNKSLRPFVKSGLKFMHDGASIHQSKLTKDWLKKNKIETIEWPAHSPDLNPIENLWGILTRVVFANGRQFKNKNDLRQEILKQWSLIKPKTILDLVESMPDRLIEVIKQNGGNTKY